MERIRRLRPTYAGVASTLALVLALGMGGAYAASKVGSKDIAKNAVKSKHIQDGQVKAPDLRAGAVKEGKIASDAVTTEKVAEGAVTTGKVADGAVTTDKIAAETLSSLTIARSTGSSCDPGSSAFVNCGEVTMNLPRAGRVLLVANAGYDGASTNGYRGDCFLAVDGAQVGPTIANGQASYVPATAGGPGFNGNGQVGTGLTAVSGVLPAGSHAFALLCNQAGGSIEFPTTYVSAVMVGAG